MSAVIIARRSTFDGSPVQFWSDGAVTHGTERSRMTWLARSLPRRLAWLVAGDVSLYDLAEVKALIGAARRAKRAYDTHPRFAGTPGPDDVELRRLMRSFASMS